MPARLMRFCTSTVRLEPHVSYFRSLTWSDLLFAASENVGTATNPWYKPEPGLNPFQGIVSASRTRPALGNIFSELNAVSGPDAVIGVGDSITLVQVGGATCLSLKPSVPFQQMVGLAVRVVGPLPLFPAPVLEQYCGDLAEPLFYLFHHDVCQFAFPG
jgi:hypothetical protein